MATNRTGEGGADPGDLYVLDTNNRVSQFTATGTFVRAFGFDAVASGQHNSGANEQQSEQWDVFVCGNCSGWYQYRHRTRRLSPFAK